MKDFRDLLCIIGTATAIMVGLLFGVYLTNKALEAFVETIIR